MKPTENLSQRISDSASSAAERKLAAALIQGFPSRALGTVEMLARRAGVSGPTVLRYLTKLGFLRYADFQTALRDEVERQLGSPVLELDRQRLDAINKGAHHAYRASLLMQAESLRLTAEQSVPAEFDRMVDTLANRRLRVRVLGGRYSRVLAHRLALQLDQIRAGVSLLEQALGFAQDGLLDIGSRDLIVIFDYRRYQLELLEFAQGAKAVGAGICLLTDIERSPIAGLAQAVLTAPNESASPFGSRVVPTAQIEALVGAVVDRDRGAARSRLARLEKLRAREPALFSDCPAKVQSYDV